MGLSGRVVLIVGMFAATVTVGALAAGRLHAAAPPAPVLAPVSSPARLGVVAGRDDPHQLDLARLVPRGGTINHVWFVPQGRTRTQVLVAWQRGRNAYWERKDPRRFALTLWNPEEVKNRTWAPMNWVPHTLIAASPFPIADYTGHSAIRLADVTGDGRVDLLVTIGCVGCNHGTSIVFVAATFGRQVRKIYGHGFLSTKDPNVGVHGRVIYESEWGSKNGLLWFITPYQSWFSGIHVVTILKWTNQRWHTVSQRNVRGEDLERLNLGN